MGYTVRSDIKRRYVKKLFVRDSYQKIFEEKLQAATKDLGNSKIHVLNYYGIGGIGKTSICSLIEKKLKDENKKIKYAYYDFCFGKDVDDVLNSMKMSIENKYRFKFPLFELAMCLLEQKKDHSKIDFFDQSFLNNHSCISNCVEVLGGVPVLGGLVSMVKILDAIGSVMQGFFSQYDFKKYLHEMEFMSGAELIDLLPYYFSIDMKNNLKKQKLPFVFFLDTYEKSETFMDIDNMLDEDWLRGEDGLIQNIPNALWVISGRNKLRWREWDANWSEDILCSHPVKAFSDEDSRQYLIENEITDKQLIENIIQKTKGYPIYLDLYVDYYKEHQDVDCEIKDVVLNEKVLIQRIFQAYNEQQKEVFWLLICLKRWTSKDIKTLLENMSGTDFSAIYEEIEYTSLIMHTKRYSYVSDDIWEIMMRHCPSRSLLQFCKIWVNHAFDFTDSMECLMLNIETIKTLDLEVYRGILSKLEALLKGFMNDFQYQRIKKILDIGLRNPISEHCKELEYILKAYQIWLLIYEGEYTKAVNVSENEIIENCMFADVLMKAKGIALRRSGQYEKAFEVNKKLIKCTKDVEIKSDAIIEQIGILNMQGKYKDVLKVGNHLLKKGVLDDKKLMTLYTELGMVMYKTGKYKEALDYIQKSVQIIKHMNLANPFPLLNAKCNEATVLVGMKQFDVAEAIYVEVYDEYNNRLGKQHPISFQILCNIGSCYSGKGEHQRALTTYEEIYSVYKTIYGTENAETYYMLRLIASEKFYCGDIVNAVDMMSSVYEFMLHKYGEESEEVQSVGRRLAFMRSQLSNP